MTSYVETDNNNMEMGVTPSQFLNLVIDETHTNIKRKNETVTSFSSISKSMKRALESETTITPIYTKSKQVKLGNGNSGHMGIGGSNDFTIKWPATLLAECTVEISNIPNKNPLPNNEKSITITKNNITKYENKLAVEKQVVFKDSSTRLHEFPRDEETCSLWLKACGLSSKEFVSNLSICSRHFKKDNFQSCSEIVLKPHAIPSKFMKSIKQNQLQSRICHNKSVADDNKNKTSQNYSPTLMNNQPLTDNIRNVIESSRVPIVFNDMLNDWEPFKWDLDKWNSLFENQSLNCRKGKITCTKEPLWENKCSYKSRTFCEIMEMSKNVENNGDWLYFDYKYIGEKVDEKIFESISWKKFGYENLGAKDSTLWIGSTGAHTPCHQDLYGINLVAQVHGKKRWILMPPEMGKYLKPSRVPYEESSCYSKINFSCPDNIKDIDDNCRCVSVILSPGDVLFVPNKWWHYVENLSTAVSINTWIQTPKYDNMARLSESVVRFIASSISSGVSENIRLQLLNPNEIFSSSMIAESIGFIDQSVKLVESNEDPSDSLKSNSSSFLNYKYNIFQPEEFLNKIKFDTLYHRNNHTENDLLSDLNIDISHRLLDAICDENVIKQIVNNLIKKNR